jgi:uncharacterized protein
MRRRRVLITGGSSGIGEAFADLFAAEGFDLVLVARREERLQAVARRLESQFGVIADILVADLAEAKAPQRICANFEARGLEIDALVNNAGYGIPGSFAAADWPRHAAMLQVMVVAVAELTHRLLPGMVARRYGRVINVASLAALVPAPGGHTLYAATKAFLVKFSEALAHEVTPSGVHVTALCPGFTYSEFHDITGTREQVRHLPGWFWMDAPAVAREGYDAVMAGVPVHVSGRINRSIATLARMIPQRALVEFGRRTAWRYRKK